MKCLEVADHYDMSRKVYQWRDQENVRDDIRQLSLEDRGEVLDLWQSVSKKALCMFRVSAD